ncbi:hypothetical protein SAMN04488587_0422 [Methanococcoides vulcani]|uniref:Uncharacterized protein n=1 Tax=Methanococcoides vulcani TaxID=1353158 RepID=A0A1H9YBR2_9EURY|nr:hypothetical protein [Methanococcoides vulcani]SES66414.1 hypothetical protein SAMN04488587_0422 [Methanococcoides vulcani]
MSDSYGSETMNDLASFETEFVRTVEYMPITSDLLIVIVASVLVIGMLVGYGIAVARHERTPTLLSYSEYFHPTYLKFI